MDGGTSRRGGRLELHRGINFSSLEIGGDFGGLVFVVGTIVCLLIGLPEARVMFFGGLAGGAIVAAILVRWGRRHATRSSGGPIVLGLGQVEPPQRGTGGAVDRTPGGPDATLAVAGAA